MKMIETLEPCEVRLAIRDYIAKYFRGQDIADYASSGFMKLEIVKAEPNGPTIKVTVTPLQDDD